MLHQQSLKSKLLRLLSLLSMSVSFCFIGCLSIRMLFSSYLQALFDLENTNQELKSELKDLYINQAVYVLCFLAWKDFHYGSLTELSPFSILCSQMDISGNRKAVVIYVPFRLRKAFRKIHLRLVRELEKKFSGKDVIFVATRRIMRPPKKGSAVQRPRNRTLTSVHEAMLEDVAYPAEIVGKRTRYRLDGTKIMKVKTFTNSLIFAPCLKLFYNMSHSFLTLGRYFWIVS